MKKGFTEDDQLLIERWAEQNDTKAPITATFRYMGRWYDSPFPFLIWMDTDLPRTMRRGRYEKTRIETRGTETVNRPLPIAEHWCEYWSDCWGWLRYR